jgi:hypothetical protein
MVLHIGTGKTGTSSIQKYFSNASDNDLLPQISYPRVYLPHSHHTFMTAAYRQSGRITRDPKLDERFRQNIGEYKSQLFDILNDSKNSILSSEVFGYFKEDEIFAFKKDLRNLGFRDIYVLIYVRNPASYYLSSTQQKLKGSKFIKDPNFVYPFKTIINTWNVHFPDKIIAKPFERSKLINSCVVQDFIDTISQVFGIDNLEFNRDIFNEENESVSAEGMYILQSYRSLFYSNEDDILKKDSAKLARILMKSKEHIRQTEPKLKKEIEQLIINNHMDDLKWLKKHHKISFADINYNITEHDMHCDIYEKENFSLDDILQYYNKDIVSDVLWYALKIALK